MPRISKKFALLVVFAMLATMFMGMGTASALGTYATLNGAPSVSKSDTDAGDVLRDLGTITGVIDAGSLSANTKLSVKLPKNFEFNPALVDSNTSNAGSGTSTVFYYPAEIKGEANALYDVDVTLELLNPNELIVSLDAAPDVSADSYFYLYLGDVYVPSSASGDITATLSSNAGWGSGSVVVAKVNDGLVTVAVDETKSLTSDSDSMDLTLRFTENMAAALKEDDRAITLKLPAGFSWDGQAALTPIADVVWGSGPVGSYGERTNDERYLDIKIDTASTTKSCFTIDVSVAVEDESTAKFGDITAILDTNGDTDLANTENLLLGTYGDYGITVAAASTPDVYAGQLEQEIGDITITESAAGSLIGDRYFTLTLSDNAKWGKADESPALDEIDGVELFKVVGNDGQVLKYEVGTESEEEAGSITFEDMEIVLAPDASGDVSVVIEGSGIDATVVVAKAVAPLTITCASQDVQLGVQEQAASDIVIKEAAAGLLKNDENLVITLPDGVTWASTPSATVSDGDLLIDADNMDTDDEVLTIPIDGDSSTASTITLTNVKYSVDRTYPEGLAEASFGGGAIVCVNDEDQIIDYFAAIVDADDVAYDPADGDVWGYYVDVDGNNEGDYRIYEDPDGIFGAKTSVADVKVANCVTPAPDDKTALATFVIGAAKYTVNGVEVTMDVAPYIKDSRTFMPIRYVANALGISDANILWDADLQTVTLMKGDKVVQLKIGSTTMLVNGAAVTMDVAPEINNGRTCLPIALVANAFGATASWDAATQTVTIQ